MEIADLPAVVPSAGVVGLLVVFVIRVTVLASQDRNDYRVRLVEQRREHRAELDELRQQIGIMRQQHAAEIAELRAEIKELRAEVETERRARHHAEEDAARLRRQVRLDGGGNG